MAGRPTLIKGNSQILFGTMGRLQENSIVNIKNRSHSVTAQVIVPKGGAAGVVIHQGGRFGGWAMYVHDGKLSYCYNTFGWKSFTTRADSALPEGNHQVRMEFEYDGGGLGKGGNVTLFVDGKKVGAGRVEITVPMAFSADETCDVGADTGTPVSSDYTIEDSAFTGKVLGVQIDVGKADADRSMSAEDRLRVAMARQ
jgi:arylsulfatase